MINLIAPRPLYDTQGKAITLIPPKSPAMNLKALLNHFFILFQVSVILFSCQHSTDNMPENTEPPSLRSIFAEDFTIGAALGSVQVNGNNPKELNLIAREFSSVTAENIMKWILIHPTPDSFNFELPDKLVEVAQNNNQQIIGHTLTWHNQTPNWLFEDENGELIDSTTLYSSMKKHIETVVGRYKGKIAGWDVVNEAIKDDGTFRNSKFYQISGEGYLYKAFEYAAAADPDMELYYNDYSMHRPDKVAGAIALANKIREKDLRIDGIGMQGHWGLDGPPVEEIEASIISIYEAGLKVMITELDLDVLPNPREIEGAELSQSFESNLEANPYVNGLPDSVNHVHADRYEDLFRLFYKHRDKISRITFWGVHDGQSWKNNWPARGRTNYCLVFDRNLDPKLAYEQILGIKNLGGKE